MGNIEMRHTIKTIGLLLLAGCLLCTGCRKKKEVTLPKAPAREIKKIEEEHPLHICRYDQALFSLPQQNLAAELEGLKKDYYFFIGDNPSVPQLAAYLNDPVNQRLYKEVQEKYADLSALEKQFQEAFARIRYHFPEARLPRIYTIISGLSYETPVIFVDSVLIVAIDMYMGSDYHFYKKLGEALPKFIRKRLAEPYILPDCMKELSYAFIHSNNASSCILDDMLLEGKRWLFAELALPQIPDSLITGYTAAQSAWIDAYEYDVWSFLIEKNYLYSNDNLVSRKLVGEAPFTAYFGNDSPGCIGRWIGWQICRSWIANNPDRPLKELFEEKNPQQILKDSKYRPEKK